MNRQIRSSVLLAGACLFASTGIWAQVTQSATGRAPISTDVAVTYSPERAQIVYGQCCFWLQGGGVDGAVNFWKGLGIAGSLTGEQTANVSTGVDINKITYLAGPRYTYTAWLGKATSANRHRVQLFGQALFGGVHGFNGLYPAPGAPTTSADSFAIEAGGGLNFYLSRHFGLRLAEADYVRNELPNNAANIQNDLRLAFGATLHF